MGEQVTAIWDMIIEDMRGRDQVGVATYRTRLYPDTPGDPLVHAYEEALDLVAYLRWEIERRKDGAASWG